MAWTRRAYDTFTDSVSVPLSSHTPNEGSAWVGDVGGTDWLIGINYGTYGGASSNARCRNTTTLGKRQKVEASMNSAAMVAGLMLLMDSSGNGYDLIWRPDGVNNDLILDKLTAGSRTTLTSTSSVPGSGGDFFSLETDGYGHLIARINGVQILTATDTTYTTGSAGLFSYGASLCLLDNFAAYDDAVVVTSTIGTTSRDYSTIQAWIDDWPTDIRYGTGTDEIWRGVLYNDSKFTAGAFVGEGNASDGRSYFELTAAPGHSFRDHPDVRSNPLGTVSEAYGVYIEQNLSYAGVFDLRTPHLRMNGLQIRNTSGNGFAIVNQANPGAGCFHVFTDVIGIANRGQAIFGSTHAMYINCISVNLNGAGYGFALSELSTAIGCLAISPSDVGSSNAGFQDTYHVGKMVSCGVFGFAAPVYPASTGEVDSEGNATDCSSGFPGSGDQYSVPFSRTSPFIDAKSSALDLRAIAGTALIGNGVLDSTNAPNDISGLARDDPPTIGPWEVEPDSLVVDHRSDGGSVNGTNLSWLHTCSGVDRYLDIGLKFYGTDDLTSVTFNGVAATRVEAVALPFESSYAMLYRLQNPAEGEHTISVSRSAADFIVGLAVSYAGVAASQPEDSATDAAGPTSYVAPTVTVGGAAWLSGVCVSAYNGNVLIARPDLHPTVEIIEASVLVGILGMYTSPGPVTAGTRALAFGQQSSSTSQLAGIVSSLRVATAVAGGDLDLDKAEALSVTDAVSVALGLPPLPVSPGVQRQYVGTAQLVWTAGSTFFTGDVVSGAYDNTADPVVPRAPLALATLAITGFSGGTPPAGSRVELWGVLDGDTDAPVSTSTLLGARFFGEWFIAPVNAAQRHSVVVSMEGVEQVMLYVVNRAGQDILTGTTVKVTPLAYGVAT